MRIDKFYIYKFKNINNLLVDFDEESFFTVLIGMNGVGKSNILEAVSLTFKSLYLKSSPIFDYYIIYNMKGETVKVSHANNASKFEILDKGNFKEVTAKKFYKLDLLPKNIFGYYSGASKRFEEVFADHFQNYLVKLKKDTLKRSLRPMFWIRDSYAPFVFLSLLLDNDLIAKEFISEFLKVENFKSLEFTLKEPGKKLGTDKGILVNDTGPSGRFFKSLSSLDQNPIYSIVYKDNIISKKNGYTVIKFKITSYDQLMSLFYGQSPKQVFQLLEDIFLLGFLDGLDIKFTTFGSSELVSFNELSEGQKQILLTVGMLRLNQEEDSLYLLDEPDTQLNPKWSREFLSIIKSFVTYQKTSQFILTSHNPLTFSSLEKSEVIILEKSQDHILRSRQPDRDPKGMGVSSILTSEFFDLETSFDMETYKIIQERRTLLALKEKSLNQVERINQLNDTLFEADYTGGDLDRIYTNFLIALKKIKPEYFEYKSGEDSVKDLEFEKILRETVNEI